MYYFFLHFFPYPFPLNLLQINCLFHPPPPFKKIGFHKKKSSFITIFDGVSPSIVCFNEKKYGKNNTIYHSISWFTHFTHETTIPHTPSTKLEVTIFGVTSCSVLFLFLLFCTKILQHLKKYSLEHRKISIIINFFWCHSYLFLIRKGNHPLPPPNECLPPLSPSSNDYFSCCPPFLKIKINPLHNTSFFFWWYRKKMQVLSIYLFLVGKATTTTTKMPKKNIEWVNRLSAQLPPRPPLTVSALTIIKFCREENKKNAQN